MCGTRISSLLWKITVLVMVGLCVNTAAALDGSGIEQDPWRITSLSDFDEFAADANYWNDYTRLETDVNLADTRTPGYTTVPSGNGDIVMRVTHTGGTYSINVQIYYHTHS